MNKHNYPVHNNVRFRRWSRANYAIFSSLSRCVTIGTVCASICEMSCKKGNALTTQKFNQILSENNDEEDEENDKTELSLSLQNYLKQILINNSLSSTAAAAAVIITIIYSIYTPAVGMISLIPTAFFMSYYEKNFYHFIRLSIHYPLHFITVRRVIG